jgi:hypothetical protein
MQTLPIILPPNQDYSCHFEWESDIEQGRDKAEELWERLALECGMEPQSLVQSSPRRGRWKVKVTETPILGGEEDTKPPEKSHSSVIAYEESNPCFLGDDVVPLPAVLREVDDILPQVDQYKRLAATVRRRTSKSKRHPSIKRHNSKKTMHRDIKRSLRCLWGVQPLVDTVASAHMELLMKRGSESKSTMGRSTSLQELTPAGVVQQLVSSGKTGLGISMDRSITLESTTIDSIIDLYMDR